MVVLVVHKVLVVFLGDVQLDGKVNHATLRHVKLELVNADSLQLVIEKRDHQETTEEHGASLEAGVAPLDPEVSDAHLAGVLNKDEVLVPTALLKQAFVRLVQVLLDVGHAELTSAVEVLVGVDGLAVRAELLVEPVLADDIRALFIALSLTIDLVVVASLVRPGLKDLGSGYLAEVLHGQLVLIDSYASIHDLTNSSLRALQAYLAKVERSQLALSRAVALVAK